MNRKGDDKRVGIWIRVSTEDQVRGESPEHHERRARLYAEAKEWDVVEVYRLDAVSGKTVKAHPETKRMLADISSGHITGLIFSKLARLARNTIELLEFADQFREHGADLVSLGESIDTSTPAGRLFYTMVGAMAQWEREEIAARVAASVPIRARLGKPLGGQAPFGYQWVEQKFIPHPDEAPVRKLIYELFIEHKRKKVVARLLNERGYRTRNGGPFSDTTVDRLLRDATAKGVRRANHTKSLAKNGAWVSKPERDWVFHEVPSIVSEELWSECNDFLSAQRLKGKRITQRVKHLFAGLVYCRCGTKMYVPSDSSKYTCQKCRNKMPIADLEAIFEQELTNFVVSPKELTTHLERGKESLQAKQVLVDNLVKDQKRVRTEIESLHDLFQSGAIDKKGFGAKYHQLAERQSQLEDEVPQVEAERDVLKISILSQEEVFTEAKDLFSRWQTLGADEKRRIVETLVDRINVDKEEIEIKVLYSPPAKTAGGGNPPSSSTPLSGNGSNRATNPQGFIAPTS
ncbi:MAG: Site-specific recombinase [Betaproteobacteria bacterium]|nr:Site-specific recombinase [Betaproteobacteria bacterium]